MSSTRREWIRRSSVAVSLLAAGIPGSVAGSTQGSTQSFSIESVRIGRATGDGIQVTSALESGEKLGVGVDYTAPADATIEVSLGGAETEQTAVIEETLASGEQMETTVETAVDEFETGAYEVTATIESDGERSTTVRDLEFVTDLSMAERRNRDHVRAAVEHLHDAFEAYGEAAAHEGDSTLLHVLPSMDVSPRDAVEELNAAMDEVSLARDFHETEAQWQRSLTARQNIRMIEELARLQSSVHDIYESLETEYDVYDDVLDRNTDVRYDSDEVDELIDEHDEITTLTDNWEPLVAGIETKLTQLDWQLTQLEDTYDAVELMWGTSHPFARYQIARDDFESIQTELEDETAAAPEDITDDAFIDLVSDWWDEADDELRSVLDG